MYVGICNALANLYLCSPGFIVCFIEMCVVCAVLLILFFVSFCRFFYLCDRITVNETGNSTNFLLLCCNNVIL